MKKLKKSRKILSALIVMCIFASFSLIPSAESTTTNAAGTTTPSTTTTLPANAALTSNEKAQILNKITILKGDGTGDYKLNSQLKRSEAAAFIIRLLGKETFVLENKSNYIDTSYTDVKKTDWFAPYVGYCSEEGIIAGTGNNIYDPNAYTSEKAFLKLVLVSLGYEYGEDFTWSEVYKKAYEVKLVTSTDYLTRTADNNNFTREGVVNILYNSLSQQKNGSKDTLLQTLINEGAVSLAVAKSAGLVGDTSVATITQCDAVDNNTLLINLDKSVDDIKAENVKVYETGNIAKQLTASVLSKQNNILVVKTANQSAYTNYTIEIYNVKVTGSVVSSTVTGAFTGYKASVVTSEFFRISKAVAVSKNIINVYFTHPLNSNCEQASFYEITDANGNVFASGSTNTLSANYAVTPDNVAILTLSGKTLTAGTQYTVKVSGDLTSLYGVKLNEGETDLIKFAGIDTENVEFKVTGTAVIDYKTLQITFNREVNVTRAQQVFNYCLTDYNGKQMEISKAVVAGSGAGKNMQVHLSVASTFLTNQPYSLLINELNDASKQYTISEKTYSFSGTTSTSAILAISSVSAIDKGSISIVFNKALDETTANTLGYYIISGVTATGYMAQPVSVYFDAENSPNTVKLYLPVNSPLTSSRTYQLTVTPSMKDYLGNTAAAKMDFIFTGTSNELVKPTVSDAVIISGDTIKVTFSKEISVGAPNILASNYSLQYDDNGTIKTKVPLIAGYINDKTIILKFDALSMDKKYTLLFKSLKDYSGLYTRTSADGSNTFTVRAGK